MITACANPDCKAAFDYRGQGRFFRFHKDAVAGETPNTHCIQHFWLCGECCQTFTLEYQDGAGVLIKTRNDIACESESFRFIAAA